MPTDNHEPNLTNAVLIPMTRAAVTGALFFLLALALGLLAEVDHPATLAFVTGALTGALNWLALQVANPINTKPHTNAVIITRLEIASDQNRRIQIADLPCDPERLASLARGVLAGATLSEAQWAGGGALFTRAEFAHLRTAFLARHLAEWTSPGYPARGVRLTRGGWAAMRHLATSPPAEAGAPAKPDALPPDGFRPIPGR
jgi:hypothetical protein